MKEERIKQLRNDAKDVSFLKLPATDRKKLYRHYMKKIKFYEMQENTKWQSLPTNPPLDKDPKKEDKKL